MTYYICRYPDCYQLGRLLPDDTVEGFNVVVCANSIDLGFWSWGHVENIAKTHEFGPDSPHHETCEAAWTAFALGSRKAAYELLKEVVP